jgi:hypothetical protein
MRITPININILVEKCCFSAKRGRFCFKRAIIFIGHFYASIKNRRNRIKTRGGHQEQRDVTA